MSHFQDMPLLLVALIVFVGLFVYMIGVDKRVRMMERELVEEIEAVEAEDKAMSSHRSQSRREEI